MPVDRIARRSLSERACLECQKRKTRCVPAEDGQSCAYCSRSRKSCVFDIPKPRTPLTRQNLDQAEARCKQLEELLSHAQSVVDVNSEVQTTQPRSKAVGNGSEPGSVPSAPYEWSEVLDPGDGNQSSDGEDGRDGMASLASKSDDAGYLGKSSGHEILQSVSSLLPTQSKTSSDYARPAEQTPATAAINQMVGTGSISPATFSTSIIQDQLISAFFIGFNSSYPILHEQTFRKQCSTRRQLSPRSSWHVAYFAVLAIGEWLSGYCDDEPSLYYEAARGRLSMETLETGTLNNVQAFMLLGNYLQKRDRPNTGYNYIGIALRMAMGLGLRRELPQSSGTGQLAMQRRRAVFWVLYCLDCWFNITTGRPTILSDAFIDIRIPANIDETQCDSLSDAITEASYPTCYSAAIALARLTKIANRIYSQFMCVNPCSDIDHQATVMEHMIHNWHKSLPSYFFQPDVPLCFLGPRQVVLWKESNLLILLLLSSQKHHIDEHEKLAIGVRCQTVAASSIADIAYFCQQHTDVIHHGLTWYAVYFILQATLSSSVQQISRYRLSSLSVSQREEDLQNYDKVATQAYDCLQTLSGKSRAAVRSMRIVSRLRSYVRQSSTHSEMDDPTHIDVSHYRTRNHVTTDSRKQSSDLRGVQKASGHPNGIAHYTGPFPTNRNAEAPMDFRTMAHSVLSEWTAAADPSLHALFDGDWNINDMFLNFDGSPTFYSGDTNAPCTNGSPDTMWEASDSRNAEDRGSNDHQWLC